MPSPPEALAEAIAALEAHEAWDSDLLLNGDWSAPTLALTQDQLERLGPVRARCLAALASLKGAAHD